MLTVRCRGTVNGKACKPNLRKTVHGPELGPLVPTAVSVQGQNWRSSSMDIAVAGGEGWTAAVASTHVHTMQIHECICTPSLKLA